MKRFPNAVIHVINGIVSMDELSALSMNQFKILILGYKTFRRGAKNYVEHTTDILKKHQALFEGLPDVIQQGWFQTVSFDNLAIKQLKVRRLMDDASWEQFYMGDDGGYTMYIDAVNREYAVCSVSEVRHPLTDNIKEMFDVVRRERRM